MRGRRLRLAMGLWLPLLPFAFGGLVAAWAQPQKQVLVVYSTRRDAQIVAIGERELPRILEQGLGRLDYYSEYIDDARFSDSSVPGRLQGLPPPQVQERALRRGHCGSGRRARTCQRRAKPVVSWRAHCLFRLGPGERPDRKCDRPRRRPDLHGYARVGRRSAATGSPDLCRQWRVAVRHGVRASGAAAIRAVRVPIQDHVFRWPAVYRTRVPPAEPAGQLGHLLLDRQS